VRIPPMVAADGGRPLGPEGTHFARVAERASRLPAPSPRPLSGCTTTTTITIMSATLGSDSGLTAHFSRSSRSDTKIIPGRQ
jgi:hypothetical protein